LVRARGTDFAAPRTDVASIGTVVRATDLATNQQGHFNILGAWDSDPEKDIVSYLSPVAQSLLGHKVGDEVEFEIHGVRHQHRIESIEACGGAAVPVPPLPAPQPPAA
jgi:transcription elongation GreA/GreB family factor